MKKADIDHMGIVDISCMMMQNCFTDPTLKAKLGSVKSPTLDVFNDFIESHKAGKKAANMSAIAIKSRKGKGRASR